MINAKTLRQAVEAYLQAAYPSGVPTAVRDRLGPVEALPPDAMVPESFFELREANGRKSYALRLGQPIYPHMKLVIEWCPGGGYLFRADAHDSILHAPPGSPDEAALAKLRMENKRIAEAIEAAWRALGLPTFQDFLRKEVERRKAGASPKPDGGCP